METGVVQRPPTRLGTPESSRNALVHPFDSLGPTGHLRHIFYHTYHRLTSPALDCLDSTRLCSATVVLGTSSVFRSDRRTEYGCSQAVPLLTGIEAGAVIADKGCYNNWVLAFIQNCAMEGNMPWLEISSLVVAGIAALIASGSLLISRRAQNISEIQALPKVGLGLTWSGGGGRDLYINLEQISGHPDWVVASATVRRTWRNWHERCFLARGEVVDHFEDEYRLILPCTKRTGNWERRITYEPPIREASIFLHPDAPDCEVTLEITLSTSPSPTIKRHIKSLRESPSRRRPPSVIE